MLHAEQLSFSYNFGKADAIIALKAIDLQIRPGELVALIGHNGSGKSTLAKLLSGILMPTGGRFSVDSIPGDEAQIWEIRRRVGMVFQRPDDQLIANTVIDDIAFGPENLGLPRDEIEARVQGALAALGIAAVAHKQISELSGGEKQRVAIAGVLAMQPSYLILDEPTTMLAPAMARQVLRLAHELREREGLAVIHITHFMSEVVDFDRLVVLEAGEILMQGTPHEIFAQADELEAIGLGVPAVTRFARRLYAHGIKLPQTVLTAEELAAQLGARINGVAAIPESDPLPEAPTGTPLIETRGLHYSYMAGTPLEQQALRGVDCTVYAGETLAILGGTQAGKSTLIEFFNGLRLPAPGAVFYKGEDIVAPGFDLDRLREEIGIVFQQPEAQLFEDIVGMDVSYVPRRKGLPPAESRALVEQSLAAVGLDYETFRLRYVYALSGGQKRRVALAGVLAAQPQVLILDEPVAGLDPRGRAELSALIGSLAKQRKLTVVLVGNVIDELAELADRAIVLHEGRAVMQGSLRKLLRRADELYALGLELSDAAQIALALRSIIPGLPTDVLTLDELEAALLPHLAHTTPMYALDPTTDANKH